MGTWGVKPFENDSAGDLIYEIFGKLEKIINHAIGRHWSRSDSGEVRAAIVLYTAIHNVFGYRMDADSKQGMLTYLKTISTDPEYLNDWRSPKAVKVQILKEITELKKLKVN